MALKLQIKASYISGWWVVGLPTIIFLLCFFGIWLGVPYIIYSYYGYNGDWLDILAGLFWIPAAVIGFIIAIITYKPLWQLQEKLNKNKIKQNKFSELQLENGILSWNLGKKRSINLALPHTAIIKAGEGALHSINSTIDIRNNKESLTIHLAGLSRSGVLRFFPNDYFVEKLAITPYEGLPGFTLNANNEGEKKFFTTLLAALWEKREQNELFKIYQKFPWERPPQPEVNYIRELDYNKLAALGSADKSLLEQLQKQVIYALADVGLAVTPDYLLGYQMKGLIQGLREVVTGQKRTPVWRHFIMPLSHITAKVLPPRPNWKSFLTARVIINLVSQFGSTATSAAGPQMTDSRNLLIKGYLQDGRTVALLFPWYMTVDSHYRESEVFLKFIQRRF